MYLGFDTSNYTTSVALFDGKNVFQSKKLLKVKSGERGLRQSDAVFQHTVNMPEILAELEKDCISGLSLLGGEPFEPENIPALTELLKTVKVLFPEKKVWCYTGFEFEVLKEKAREMLSLTDVLVDGKFIEERKSPDLIFRGSSNQRIIDVQKSLKEDGAIWLDGVWERRMGSGNIYE